MGTRTLGALRTLRALQLLLRVYLWPSSLWVIACGRYSDRRQSGAAPVVHDFLKFDVSAQSEESEA